MLIYKFYESFFFQYNKNDNYTTYLSDDRNDTVLWMLLDGKGLEIVTYIVILILYTKLKFHLKTKVLFLLPPEAPKISSLLALSYLNYSYLNYSYLNCSCLILRVIKANMMHNKNLLLSVLMQSNFLPFSL